MRKIRPGGGIDPEDEDPYDRFSLSVRKGYGVWLDRVAKERNQDRSKLVREAVEEWIKSHRLELSDNAMKSLERMRRLHGTQYDDFL